MFFVFLRFRTSLFCYSARHYISTYYVLLFSSPNCFIHFNAHLRLRGYSNVTLIFAFPSSNFNTHTKVAVNKNYLRKSKGLCTCAPKGNIEEFFKCVQQLSELLARGCEASLPAKSGISKLMHSCKRAIASTCNTNTNPWQYSIPYIEMLK